MAPIEAGHRFGKMLAPGPECSDDEVGTRVVAHGARWKGQLPRDNMWHNTAHGQGLVLCQM
jgi:hypothetical protein